MSRLVSSLRTRWRVWFPTQLSDDEFYVTLQRDVKDVQTHLTDAFRHRKIFLDTTEILKKHPTLREQYRCRLLVRLASDPLRALHHHGR